MVAERRSRPGRDPGEAQTDGDAHARGRTRALHRRGFFRGPVPAATGPKPPRRHYFERNWMSPGQVARPRRLRVAARLAGDEDLLVEARVLLEGALGAGLAVGRHGLEVPEPDGLLPVAGHPDAVAAALGGVGGPRRATCDQALAVALDELRDAEGLVGTGVRDRREVGLPDDVAGGLLLGGRQALALGGLVLRRAADKEADRERGDEAERAEQDRAAAAGRARPGRAASCGPLAPVGELVVGLIVEQGARAGCVRTGAGDLRQVTRGDALQFGGDDAGQPRSAADASSAVRVASASSPACWPSR